jgi:hypothetical protein
VGIWYAITSISLLPTVVLWLGAASPDSFRILHIVAFVTLCEAMGIEPHFNLWNYFFRASLWQGSDVALAVLGSVDLFV